MKKQTLFIVVLFCLTSLSLVGQNKYNDLIANQLTGAVKEVNTIRKLYGNVDFGDKDVEWNTQFDIRGYITQSEGYIYKWNENYTQCSCEASPENRGDYNTFCKLNVVIVNNEYNLEGKFIEESIGGGVPIKINYGFDSLGRLNSIKNNTNYSLKWFSLNASATQIFRYKGNDKIPYKVECSMENGGESWGINFLIKYVKVDSQGNWTHRKLYNIENGQQYVEEIRTITYYNESGNSVSTHPKVGQNKIPTFIGGESAMKKFFADNANPRKPAIITAGYGEVIVEFTVTETGEVINPKWKGRVSVSMDEEALRLVKMMPKWNPGIVDGEPAKTKVQVGLRFFPNQEFRFIKAMMY